MGKIKSTVICVDQGEDKGEDKSLLDPISPAVTLLSGKVYDEQVVNVPRPNGWEGQWREELVIRRYMLFTQCDYPDSSAVTIFRGEEKEAALQTYLKQVRAGFPVEPGAFWWTTARTRNELRVETFNRECKFWWSFRTGNRFPEREILVLGDRYARCEHKFGISPLYDWVEITMVEAMSLIAEHGWSDQEPLQ